MRPLRMPNRIIRFCAGFLSLVLILSLVTGFGSSARIVHAATTWTVNNTADTGGTCPTANTCTLRQAINSAASGDTIGFSIGSGAQTITLGGTDLPIITVPITIDGSTQNGFTNLPLITIDAANGSRIFDVETSSGTTQISALRLINGNGSGAGVAGSPGDGGAIYVRMTNSGSLTVTNAVFFNNVVSGSGDGGGLYNEQFGTQTGSVTVTDSTFTGNKTLANNGGAVYNNGSQVNLNRDTMNSLVVNGNGGAVTASNGSTITITNSTLDSNIAGTGGALYLENLSTMNVLATDITDNQAGAGGGIYINANTTFTLQNSIISNNSGADDTTANGVVQSLDYNFDDSTFGTTFTGLTTHNVYATDPMLQALANNGGLTQTKALAATSPAIDYIPLAACAGLTVDQRGFNRPAPPGGNCDVGPYEAQASFPTSTATNTTIPTNTPTNTSTGTATNTTIPTNTPTYTIVSKATNTNTATGTASHTVTGTATVSPTSTSTGSITAQPTNTTTATATTSGTATNTSTSTTTSTGTLPTVMPTGSATASPTSRATLPPGITSTPNVNVADPAIAKAADKNLVLPGDTVTFTLTVTNRGTAPASSVVVTDTLPPQLQVTAVTSGQGTFTTIANVVTFAIGTVNPGQVITLTIVTKVSSTITPPADLVNAATLTWPGGSSRVSNSVMIHITGGNLPATGEHPADPMPIGLIGVLLAIGLFSASRLFIRRRTS